MRRVVPRIDFDLAAVFPAQRSPSPAALDLVQTMREALGELDGMTARQTHEDLFEL
jgi:hypothetical protein